MKLKLQYWYLCLTAGLVIACDDYTRMEDGKCAQLCVGKMLGFCPRAIVVKFGNLKKQTCAAAGFTHDTKIIHHAAAGPCGKLASRIYEWPTTTAPTPTEITTLNGFIRFLCSKNSKHRKC